MPMYDDGTREEESEMRMLKLWSKGSWRRAAQLYAPHLNKTEVDAAFEHDWAHKDDEED